MDFQNKIGLTFRILSNKISRKIDYEIAKDFSREITGQQSRVIGFIRHKSKTSDVFQKDVEDEFDTRRSTATGILQLMEKNGLLTREPVSNDARLKKIVLTEKALALHDQIILKIDRLEDQLKNGLTEEEFRTFFEIADKISKNIL